MPSEEHLAVDEKGGSGAGCPVEMQGGKRCGRPIHPAREHDKTPVCLMHSRDPEKSDEEFQKEFEAILEAAGKGIADFAMFVFPSAGYRKRKFAAVCRFEGATFTRHADFSQVEFTRDVYFRSATFTQTANFNDATFSQDAYFSQTTFKQSVTFPQATFTKGADFYWAGFTEFANFRGATFRQGARFEGTGFARNVSFNRATFMDLAAFSNATFTQKANFKGAKFIKDAYFTSAKFAQIADLTLATFMNVGAFTAVTFGQTAIFTVATFMKDASFAKATFTQNANFNMTKFEKVVDFGLAKFLGRTEFRDTAFRKDMTNSPGPIFTQAEFAEPEEVVFYGTYLGQALFYNCDVSRVKFSMLEWRKREGSQKGMLFEEVVALKTAEDLKPPKGSIDERRYHLIAELYQQLKKSYDERKDYWTAGDFHYGEMEMKRMATKPPGRFVRFIGGKTFGEERLNAARRWWHRHLSLVALYKYASQYGESYARPLWCLALVLLLFTFLFPIVGLDWNDTKSPPAATSGTQQNLSQMTNNELSYGRFYDFVKTYKGRKWLARPAFFGNSLMTALSVAGFQKELKYEPSYPWGRALALLELLLTSTLAALFLLAVRRQFQR